MKIKKTFASDGRIHHWRYRDVKSGGQHGAGDEGGVHELINDKGEFVDLNGRVLNAINANGMAKDTTGVTMKVIKDSNNKITRLEYKGGESIAVTEGGNGELRDGKNNLIAKIDRPQLALVKQETEIAKNVAEFLGSQLFQAVHPNLSANVQLTSIDDTVGPDGKPDPTGKSVYAVSIYIPNYKCDLYQDVYAQNGLEIPKEKPLLLGTAGIGKEYIDKAFKKANYQNFEKVSAPSLLFGDFDMHTGNVGVRHDGSLVRIDFAGAFRGVGLAERLRPHSHSEHLPGLGPTNRFAEYDESLKISPAFVAELDMLSAFDFSPAIFNGLTKCADYYGVDGILAFAKRANLDISHLNDIDQPDALAVGVAKQLDHAMSERQKDMSRFSAQIKADLCLSAKPVNGKWEFKGYTDVKGNTVTFRDVVLQHQDYFKDVLSGKETFKFRSTDHKSEASLIEAAKKEITFIFATEIARDPNMHAQRQTLEKVTGRKIEPLNNIDVVYEALTAALEKGVTFHDTTTFGKTAMNLSDSLVTLARAGMLQNAHKTDIEKLVKSGANLNLPLPDGSHIIDHAKDFETKKCLVENGAKFTKGAQAGLTAEEQRQLRKEQKNYESAHGIGFSGFKTQFKNAISGVIGDTKDPQATGTQILTNTGMSSGTINSDNKPPRPTRKAPPVPKRVMKEEPEEEVGEALIPAKSEERRSRHGLRQMVKDSKMSEADKEVVRNKTQEGEKLGITGGENAKQGKMVNPDAVGATRKESGKDLNRSS